MSCGLSSITPLVSLLRKFLLVAADSAVAGALSELNDFISRVDSRGHVQVQVGEHFSNLTFNELLMSSAIPSCQSLFLHKN